jgi:pimeloyl-ACP methyl ester carboxylesterase
MKESDPPELEVNDAIARLTRDWRRRIRIPNFLTLLEFARLLASPTFWIRRHPTGSGSGTALVIPGYSAGDVHYAPLRYWLGRLGYRAVLSGITANPGWFERIIEGLGRTVEEEFRRSGMRMTLIGHSLGGLQAHSVARRRPEMISHVVMLGAPLKFVGGSVAPSVSITSIYGASDLPFQPESREAHAKNIQVSGTHDGLAANARVYKELAELLADV